MSGIVRFFLLLALGLWIGQVVFFSFVVAPALFGVLGAERAGDVTSVLFPRYYQLGMAAAVVAMTSALILGRRGEPHGWWIATRVALAVGLVAMVWAALVVHPKAQRLRTAALTTGQAPGDDPAFRDVHRTAVVLNGVTLLAALAGLAAAAGALRD